MNDRLAKAKKPSEPPKKKFYTAKLNEDSADEEDIEIEKSMEIVKTPTKEEVDINNLLEKDSLLSQKNASK